MYADLEVAQIIGDVVAQKEGEGQEEVVKQCEDSVVDKKEVEGVGIIEEKDSQTEVVKSS